MLLLFGLVIFNQLFLQRNQGMIINKIKYFIFNCKSLNLIFIAIFQVYEKCFRHLLKQ